MNKDLAEIERRFREKGRLTVADNPAHEFRLGRMIGAWQWAKSNCWSSLSAAGYLHHHFLYFGYSERVDGLWFYEFAIWRFFLMIGFLDA